jgi:hypothetical protein
MTVPDGYSSDSRTFLLCSGTFSKEKQTASQKNIVMTNMHAKEQTKTVKYECYFDKLFLGMIA